MTKLPPDLAKRAVVGLALIGVAAAALWWGGLVFWLVIALVSVLMIDEWAALHGCRTRERRLTQGALAVPLVLLAPGIGPGPGWIALAAIAGSAAFVVAVVRRRGIALGILYVGLPALSLILLREEVPGGLLLAFWAMALVWACDIGAYFAGRMIGGPKLAPGISPAKTWAGLWGGVLAAAAFGAGMSALGLPLYLAIATPLLAVLAQIGDLYESAIKRRAGVKDSSNLLPGHGGLMDRLDGLVPVAMAAAMLVAVPRWIA